MGIGQAIGAGLKGLATAAKVGAGVSVVAAPETAGASLIPGAILSAIGWLLPMAVDAFLEKTPEEAAKIVKPEYDAVVARMQGSGMSSEEAQRTVDEIMAPKLAAAQESGKLGPGASLLLSLGGAALGGKVGFKMSKALAGAKAGKVAATAGEAALAKAESGAAKGVAKAKGPTGPFPGEEAGEPKGMPLGEEIGEAAKPPPVDEYFNMKKGLDQITGPMPKGKASAVQLPPMGDPDLEALAKMSAAPPRAPSTAGPAIGKPFPGESPAEMAKRLKAEALAEEWLRTSP